MLRIDFSIYTFWQTDFTAQQTAGRTWPGIVEDEMVGSFSGDSGQKQIMLAWQERTCWSDSKERAYVYNV